MVFLVYTFHGLSYVIDLYKNRIEPERNLVNYSLFVSFFPLLVAGPIERATHLLPQILKKREFNYSKAVDSLRQILWGFFKKIVIADNCKKKFPNIPIYNYLRDSRGYSMDMFSDRGHLNFKGAQFFSQKLAFDINSYLESEVLN